jgi:FkbM family methyltransferase
MAAGEDVRANRIGAWSRASIVAYDGTPSGRSGSLTTRQLLARIGPLRWTVRRIRRLREERPTRIRAGPLADMRFRVPVDADPGRYHREIYTRGDYEDSVAACLERLVRPGHVCADVGAHLGYFTLLLARLVEETGRVFSFEASPVNHAALRANVALNRLQHRVTCENAALVENDGPSAIRLFPGRFPDRSSEWTTSLDFASREDEHPMRREPLMVPAVALDDAVPERMPLQVVKMDIEGGEARALRGMTRLLRHAKPTIVLEYHGKVGWPGIEALIEAGYSFESMSGEPLPGPPSPDTEVPEQVVARTDAGRH